MSSILDTLSAPQKEAVTHGEGPLLVLSAAGSGKTRVLTNRAAHLINQGVNPSKIFISTFTNKAAREFKSRVETAVGPKAEQVWMSTLHSAGAKILRLYGKHYGIDPEFSIYDDEDSGRAVRNICKELGWPKERAPHKAIAESISRLKDAFISPSEALANIQAYPDEITDFDKDVVTVYELYEKYLIKTKACDFADLILVPTKLLQASPTTVETLGFEYLLVDEYQDINPSQNMFINALKGKHDNLTVVGDLDQGIFAFRGADGSIILNFKTTYPNAKVITLGQNYRCNKVIVAAASQLISNNKKRIVHKIWSERETASKIRFLNTKDTQEESHYVAKEILRLHEKAGIPFNEMAILYRTNMLSQQFEEACIRKKIPYYVFGAKFFARKEIKDIVRHFKFLFNKSDDLTLEQIYDTPTRGLSVATWSKIDTASRTLNMSCREIIANPTQYMDGVTKRAENALLAYDKVLTKLEDCYNNPDATMSQLFLEIVNTTGLLEWYKEKDKTEGDSSSKRCDNISKLQDIIKSGFQGTPVEKTQEFLEFVSLMMGDSGDSGDKNGVQLLTCHSAKGLEYKVVFVVACENGMFPHWRSMQEDDPDAAKEEERRLFYVAMTRAKDLLYLTRSNFRSSFGASQQITEISPFIKELPQELIEYKSTL